jgi:hypothetical protein
MKRDRIRLVVVNDRPQLQASAAPAPAGAPPVPRRRRSIDPRVFDLAAVVFSIALAFLMAYMFESLDHADRVLFCVFEGGANCG